MRDIRPPPSHKRNEALPGPVCGCLHELRSHHFDQKDRRYAPVNEQSEQSMEQT